MSPQLQLRWSGHLVRMDDQRLPKRLFYGDVAMGSRRQNGQVRRYKDTLKTSLKQLQINPEIAASTVLAHSPIAWAYSVTCASMTAEFTAMPPTPIPQTQPPLRSFLPPPSPPLQ
ncbi:unnamed protein product [Schistocephalus solidus]|uniref:Uncharacterized protein n=1 Tax=Schistocephalus solidus TaxID=70667 RepID=A0A183SLP9_SCHSO|nr:unnamed protein product [Schistocephalus solidus]